MFNFFLQGAQGTGKTSLLNDISRIEILNYKINPISEVARQKINNEYLSKEQETTIFDYFVYYGMYLSAFNNNLANNDINIFDRSIFDTIIFSRMKFGKNNHIEILGKEIFKLLIKNLNGVLYIPIEFDIVDDGFRNLDKSAQTTFDSELKLVLHEMGIDYCILRGSIEERSEIATRYIITKINRSIFN